MNSNDTQTPTPDDALEPTDDIFSPTQDEDKLAEDGTPPAAPAPRPREEQPLPPDHPEFDYDTDAQEAYDQGTQAATGADDETEGPPDKDTPSPLELKHE